MDDSIYTHYLVGSRGRIVSARATAERAQQAQADFATVGCEVEVVAREDLQVDPAKPESWNSTLTSSNVRCIIERMAVADD